MSDAPDHREQIDSTVAARVAAAADFAARARAPQDRVPLDVFESDYLADGTHVLVPCSADRDAFLAAAEARLAAVLENTAVLEAQVAEYKAMTDLQRVRRWPATDERAALARLAYARSPI